MPDAATFHRNAGPVAGAMRACNNLLVELQAMASDLEARERRARATEQKTLALALLAQERVVRDVIDLVERQRSDWDHRSRMP